MNFKVAFNTFKHHCKLQAWKSWYYHIVLILFNKYFEHGGTFLIITAIKEMSQITLLLMRTQTTTD